MADEVEHRALCREKSAGGRDNSEHRLTWRNPSSVGHPINDLVVTRADHLVENKQSDVDAGDSTRGA